MIVVFFVCVFVIFVSLLFSDLVLWHPLVREAIPREKCSFFNIVQKAFDPPPLSFEHYVVNFSEGILTKVRRRLTTIIDKITRKSMVKMSNLD